MTNLLTGVVLLSKGRTVSGVQEGRLSLHNRKRWLTNCGKTTTECKMLAIEKKSREPGDSSNQPGNFLKSETFLK